MMVTGRSAVLDQAQAFDAGADDYLVKPFESSELVARVAALLREQGVPTQTGIFGADMLVEIHNDGPVTIWLEK